MTRVEITKIQRGVLEAAAIRNNHAVWPIRGKLGLNAGAATRTINQLIKKGYAEERPASEKDPIWREDGDGKRFAAVASRAGLEAVGMLPAGKDGRGSRAAGKKPPFGDKQGVTAAVSQDGARRPRPGTKLATLVGLLGRKEGATIGELSEAVGWKAHSTRGVMSGTLQKQLGLRIASENVQQRGRVYRLA